MPLPLSTLIPAATGLVGSIFSSIGQSGTNSTNLQAIRETNQAQRELAEYQWEQNLQQWNRENAYNSPEQQMQRLAAAGLNPHLVYGNGNAIMPAGSSPEYNAPNLQAYQQDMSPINAIGQGVGDAGKLAFDAYMTQEMQAARIENLYWQNEKLASDAILNDAKEQLTLAEKAYKDGQIISQNEYNERVGDILDWSLNNAKASYDNTLAQTDKLKSDKALADAQVIAAEASANLSDAQAAAAYELVKVHHATLAEIAQRIATGKAQEAYYKMQALGQQINNYWNNKYGSNAPWWMKLTDNFLSDPDQYLDSIGLFIDKISAKFTSPGSDNKWATQAWSNFRRGSELVFKSASPLGLAYSFGDWISKKFK